MTARPRWTLQTWFLLALALTMLLMGLAGVGIAYLDHRALEAQSTRELVGLARGLAVQLDDRLTAQLQQARAIAALPDITSMDPQRQEPLLQTLYHEYTDFARLAVYDRSGQRRAVSHPGGPTSAAERASFQTAVRGTQAWEIVVSASSGRPILLINTPIRNADRQVVGAVSTPVDLEDLSSAIEGIPLGPGERTFVLDASGRALLHPDPAAIQERRDYTWLGVPTGGQPAGPGAVRYTQDREPMVAGYAPTLHTAWTVVVERPQAEVLAQANQSWRLAQAGLASGALLAVLLSVALARQLSQPLRRLSLAAQTVGAGEPAPKVSLPQSSVAEVAHLAAVFGEMRDRLAARTAEWEQAEASLRFLAEASTVLTTSLDYRETLDRVAQLVVPRLADWCMVHMVQDDGRARPVALVHPDPVKVELARTMGRRYPYRPEATLGIPQVLRTGQSELCSEVSDEGLAELAQDAEHLAMLQALGFRSVMIVPLLGHGRILGTLTLVAAESGRRYGPAELALAEELARRAAVAIDNARLYQAEQRARRSAERSAERTARLQAVTAALAEALTPEQVAEVVVHQGVAALGADAGSLALLDREGTHVEVVRMAGFAPEVIEQAVRRTGTRFALTDVSPLTDAVRLGQPIWAESREAMGLRFPHLRAAAERSPYGAWAIIPLLTEGKPVGALALNFHAAREFPAEDRDVTLALVQLCALALERTRLFEREQQARAAAEAERRRLLAVLEHIPEGVIIADAPDGHFMLYNRAALLLWGLTVQDEVAKESALETAWRAATVLYPDGRPYAQADRPLFRALRGEVVLGAEITHARPDGEYTILLANAAPITDETGRTSAAVVVFQDITQRKTLEQLKDDFLSLAAHELKTPLTGIKGYSQVLQRQLARGLSQLGAREAGILRSIDERATYMVGLVNELLDLSRIETGRLDMHPEPMDLVALLREVIDQQQQLHPGRPFAVEGSGEPLVGVWDRGRLEQVFTNLLDNATKYSPAGSPVTVWLRALGDSVEVAVQDEGIGIPATDLPHLFERHFRAGNVDRSPSGLGLGLYLSSHIVQRHGGTIWAESEEGKGATLYVRLPVDGTGRDASALDTIHVP